jgi:DNA polymerase (family 10)
METPTTSKKALNLRIARRLEETARLLSEQGANRYRVLAYLRAADTMSRLNEPVDALLLREGETGLRRLAGIGERLAQAIRILVVTGKLPMLDRLRGEVNSGALLTTVPGIGKRLAERLHHDFGIDTLEQLEAAAHAGRLKDIPGIGEKRIAGIIDSLASRLGRVATTRPMRSNTRPSVAELLNVDREYRSKAAAGVLRTIAPRRFNPGREAWLPILHTRRGRRHYVALFSNTAHAHQLGKTRDWVVLYYDGQNGEQQCTVITSQRGPLAGERIVRGRERDCRNHYETAQRQSTSAGSANGADSQQASSTHQVAG